MDDQLSQKLKALSFAAILLVLFVHSYNEDSNFATAASIHDWCYVVLFIENFISKGIARIAVPLFFLISGFLFFLSFSFTLNGIIDKYKKRLKSLVIPYLIWSVFGLLLELFLQTLPGSKGFFTKQPIIDYSFSKLLNTLLLDPISYQLWFIRDLIMLVIFSPLIGYLTKLTKGLWLGILFYYWYREPKTIALFSNEALLFFAVGGFFTSGKPRQILKYDASKYSVYFLLLWLLNVSLTTYRLTLDPDDFNLSLFINTGILLGILSIWSLYDLIDSRLIGKYSTLFAYSFIIFVFHEPLLTILKKGMFYVYGKTDLSALVVYLMAPVVAIAICILLRFAWKIFDPASYDLATGGR